MARTKPTPVQRLDKIVQRVHLASPPSTACDWEGEGWYYKCEWLSTTSVLRRASRAAWTKYHRCDSFRGLLNVSNLRVLDEYEAQHPASPTEQPAAAPPVKKQRAAGPRVYEVAGKVQLVEITPAERRKIAQMIETRGRGEFTELDLKDLADHVLYAMVEQVKVKRGETKRGLHKWLEKRDGESVLRAHCLRYLCDHSYVSGSEIKQERKRRREERSGAQ
jgi:hypothetical protein